MPNQAIKFVLVDNWEIAIEAVTVRLISELSDGKKVLWLISGGSQVPANTKIMRSISSELSSRLSIMPVDERYGPVGHPESNFAKQLADGFDAKNANLLPVLQDGLSFDETAKRFERLTVEAFQNNDVIIGQLGLGSDGHTAGILPGSPACREENSLTSYYEAPPLMRLTLSFKALKQLNAAYVLAFGEDKAKALNDLKQDLSPADQPAQIIKDIAEAYVYNDQVGE